MGLTMTQSLEHEVFLQMSKSQRLILVLLVPPNRMSIPHMGILLNLYYREQITHKILSYEGSANLRNAIHAQKDDALSYYGSSFHCSNTRREKGMYKYK